MTWDYDRKAYKAQAAKDPVWHLERLINYGLNGERLDAELLAKYLPTLRIPEDRRAFLELLIWNKPF
jgi:hypothetical protein